MDGVRSRLVDSTAPSDPAGVVLVLHGGGARPGSVDVSPAQLSVLRMVPVATRLARAGRGRLAVLRLLNSTRGWGTRPSPVDDARWALGQVRERFGADRPVALVGHSLGGRAALLAADDPAVRSVVGLATWLGPADPVGPVDGRDVLLVHGDADRVASVDRVRAAANGLGRRSGLVTVRGGSHSMLRHHAAFDGLAARWVASSLLGDQPGAVLARVLAGEREVDL
ncbi:alpha/beta fold hydrolase [Phycicoccus sp.]|mgnify:CR=1 FL=1|uniref:alpha/beta hydrolase n=1 Tax=Phycicoccus sp. TaxID=1902410 RepID=UPI002C12C08E|nr:alpha/beta fold hydrolase [Phycicoccus sp.]HMM94715.1 alpha/beta fold hydrolase [Phycicoccus sp.]